MSDYNLKITLRNGRILKAIKDAGYESQATFARANGLGPQHLNALVAMRSRPINEKDGRLTNIAQDLCDALCALPEDLWTEEQLWTKLPRNTWDFDISRDQAQAMMDGRSMEEVFEHQGVMKVLEGLRPKVRRVLEQRFIEDKTLEECAAELDLSRERVRQIECKGLRILRHPSRFKEAGNKDQVL